MGQPTMKQVTPVMLLPPPVIVTIANPAAGADFTYVAAEDQVILAARMRLVTDANVASRILVLHADDATNTFFSVFPNSAHAASGTVDYSFAPGGFNNGTAATGGVQNTGLPVYGVPLKTGWRLRSGITSKQVGDQLSTLVLLVAKLSLSS